MRVRRRGLVVVGLLAAACAVLGSAGCAPSASPTTADRAGGAAPSVRIAGRTVPYAGAQSWDLASIPARGSTVLTVFAAGSETTGGGPCGPPVIRLSAVETDRSVGVLVADYEEKASGELACPAIGFIPGPHRLVLKHPLGARRLVDAPTGRTRLLLDGSQYPDVAHPPAGFTAAVLGRNPGSRIVQRVWNGSDGTTLRVQSEAPAVVREFAPFGAIERQTTIHGSPATIYRTPGGRYGSSSVQWTPNPKQTVTVTLSNSPTRRWTTDQAEAVARSVTGYSTSPTQRLAQPTTPGIAAAEYNSADGPVHHAENDFQSSGVYVGVDCRGTGRVTLAFRGTTDTVRCTGALGHHVRRTEAAPFASSYLDVTATAGVRWSVTLARASLDGS